jgi:hypothetical protein
LKISCGTKNFCIAAIAKVLYLDDDTIRYWYQLFGEKGLSWLVDFGYKGRACELFLTMPDTTMPCSFRNG